jgi:hypothetical protein
MDMRSCGILILFFSSLVQTFLVGASLSDPVSPHLTKRGFDEKGTTMPVKKADGEKSDGKRAKAAEERSAAVKQALQLKKDFKNSAQPAHCTFPMRIVSGILVLEKQNWKLKCSRFSVWQ